MIPIDLSGKVALVTGVGDDKSFAWFISKTLQAAGARLVWAVHPRMQRIVEGFLNGTSPDDLKSKELPLGRGQLKVDRVLPCDVSYDSMADVPESVRTDRRFKRIEDEYGDYTIAGLVKKVAESHQHLDILIHSVAFSPEIRNRAVDTSRAAYLQAISISAYSLTALVRAALPLMENRPDGASVVGLTYIGGDRVVPHYGGGMSTAKAALQIDAKQLASNVGSKGVRINLVSAGPYASRAASAIGTEDHSIFKMIEYAATRSPLPRGITAEEVANTTAFLCSPLASAITGHVIYVDCGYNVMGL
ncbi:MAG: SDR family oxidoreductase [Planctomycetia bacterium]|nr:SDR family oxidoreductase [Planctomycetia bacterium]